ncbi:MAG TPA: SIS domain-containing protein, partial [Actinoplanes sp.]|nr:SIS domain-containing protein [Actinoplanes sp.]
MLHLKVESPLHASSSGRAMEELEARVERARAVFREQAAAIAALAQRIDDSFTRAVALLHATPGHVIVSGMGKSGLIGQKIAATLASTGTPSFFVHPAEAYHGDLGMITSQNTVVLLSYSGETEEVVRLLPHLRRMRVPLIGLVGRMDSTLAGQVDVALDVSVARE